ncbi:MAG: hypothetical protein HY394_03730 [Candidatus Diapherotrites archaeon]|nr:hypothetical protein [Candidatus Diapherotrites archaeon]
MIVVAMALAFFFEIANILLLVFLLSVYVQNYRQMKCAFSLGLIMFAAFLLIQNMLAAYFHFTMLAYYSLEVMQHAFILSGAQTIALAALSWVTWRE